MCIFPLNEIYTTVTPQQNRLYPCCIFFSWHFKFVRIPIESLSARLLILRKKYPFMYGVTFDMKSHLQLTANDFRHGSKPAKDPLFPQY